MQESSMNITSKKTRLPLSVMKRISPQSESSIAMACKRFLPPFLPTMAVALILLTRIGGIVGGCIDDPCKLPSLGYPLESSPSFYHRHDDACGTFCAPCYAYRPTCWREWPDCCMGCPPPAGNVSPPMLGNSILPSPTSAVYRPIVPGSPVSTMLPSPVSTPIVPPPVQKSEPAISPLPQPPTVSTPVPVPQPLPTRSTELSLAPRATVPIPSSEPWVPSSPKDIGLAPLPSESLPASNSRSLMPSPHRRQTVPYAQDLGIAPMPPESLAIAPHELTIPPLPAPRLTQDLGAAPMPQNVPQHITRTHVPLSRHAASPIDDLGIAPMPPEIPLVARVPRPPVIDRVSTTFAELDIAPMPPELPGIIR